MFKFLQLLFICNLILKVIRDLSFMRMFLNIATRVAFDQGQAEVKSRAGEKMMTTR